MPPKKGNKAKKKAGGGGNNKSKVVDEDDDDWEALLETANTAVLPAASAQEVLKPELNNKEDDEDDDDHHEAGPEDAAAAFLATQGIDVGGEKKDNKKKKKKKKTGGTEAKEEKPDNKISAKGKLIAERLRLQREEEERRIAAEEAEKKRIAEAEAAEEAERQRIEAEKERKRQKQREKVERQKSEGTYLTKVQKQKAALAAQRLEAMGAAGMLPPDAVAALESGGTKAPTKAKVVYATRKKRDGKGQQSQKKENEEEEDDIEVEKKDEVFTLDAAKPDMEENGELLSEGMIDDETKVLSSEKTTLLSAEKKEVFDDGAEKEKEDEKDEWDATPSEDDWDADSNNIDERDDLTERLKQVNTNNEHESEEDEDLVEKEKLKEQERLRQLGLDRQAREKAEAEKRTAFLAEQAEMENQEQIAAQKREEGKKRREEMEKTNLAARTREHLRCPIVVIMGHVDTGKTKLLDKIRKTNVQGGEAGGITQQIGATFFEKKTLENQTSQLNQTEKFMINVPGMLVIDTPGHESFTNLRSRGSSLCDVAILVVDLMHGLEQQTIESLNMLQKRGTPFLVSLNKVDRCYAWKTCADTPIREALKEQPEGTVAEFRTRAMEAKVQLQEQGVNSNLYWDMGADDWMNSDFVPLVPTSAISGEGVQDVLLLLCQMAQRKLWRQLMWHANLQCTVLEVKAIDGLGMTVDVLVVNGHLREGDRAVFCTLDGPIVTEIRGLLTPPPSREMRIKSEYIHHKEVKGALGVKVIGNGLDKVMAGTPVMTINPYDEEEDIKAEVMSDLTNLQQKLSVDKKGVMVQASTLGALEALLQFLREDTNPPVPVSAIGIGSIHKRDVTKISVMNEKGCPEYATILAFDVDVNTEAREHALEMGVRIFTADIIYHLFDQFTRFMDELQEKRREDAAAIAVFPSIVRILPQHVFNQKDPIIVGIEVVEGILKIGTPLCIPSIGGLHIGKVTSIESNGKEQETARKGASVAIKIVNEHNPTITYGRQFDATHSLYSTLTRQSIDALKTNFKDKLDTEDWRLVMKLKSVFNII